MGTWESGTLDTGTRCFDLLCTGKCDLAEANLKLNIESVDKIPNFFTKNSEGKIVFSDPSPMSIITTSKGHGTWIRIELKTINGVNVNSLSGIAKRMCLGIKKHSENSYFDVIHAAKLTSEYVDLFDTDTVELVPLLSKTEVTSDGYELVTTGDEIVPSDFGVTGNSFDFGSVYRVNVKDEGRWITRECDFFYALDSSSFCFNIGSIGVGPLFCQEENQWIAITTRNKLLRSADAISWFHIRDIEDSNHDVGVVYGNGVWCFNAYRVRKMKCSDDMGQTWTSMYGIGCYCLTFGNDVFMTVDVQYFLDNEKPYSKVYTSPDARIWAEVGVIPRDSTENPHSILIYGNGKWVCGTLEGTIYQSKNGKEWKHIGKVSETTELNWYGGCYAGGYFYVVNAGSPFSIMRSATGEKWEEVTQLSSMCYNITYYQNKLYSINKAGSTTYIGIPN